MSPLRGQKFPEKESTALNPPKMIDQRTCSYCYQKLTGRERVLRQRVCDKCQHALAADLRFCRCPNPRKIVMHIPEWGAEEEPLEVAGELLCRCDRCGRIA